VFDGTYHMRDLKIVVVDDAGQVVQAGSIGTLNDVVLFVGPFERTIPSNQVVELALTAAGHFQPHHCGPTLGFIGLLLFGRGGHETTIVEEGFAFALCDRFVLGEFLCFGIVLVSMSAGKQLLDGALVVFCPLRLEVGLIGSTALRTLVPVQS